MNDEFSDGLDIDDGGGSSVDIGNEVADIGPELDLGADA
jgi:hypothetical protein